MTKSKQTFKIGEGDEAFKYTARGRILETLQLLMRGEVKAPSLTRRSDHVFRLRRAGLLIDTEFRKQNEDSGESHGVYHLRSVVRPVMAAEVQNA